MPNLQETIFLALLDTKFFYKTQKNIADGLLKDVLGVAQDFYKQYKKLEKIEIPDPRLAAQIAHYEQNLAERDLAVEPKLRFSNPAYHYNIVMVGYNELNGTQARNPHPIKWEIYRWRETLTVNPRSMFYDDGMMTSYCLPDKPSGQIFYNMRTVTLNGIEVADTDTVESALFNLTPPIINIGMFAQALGARGGQILFSSPGVYVVSTSNNPHRKGYRGMVHIDSIIPREIQQYLAGQSPMNLDSINDILGAIGRNSITAESEPNERTDSNDDSKTSFADAERERRSKAESEKSSDKESRGSLM